MDLRMMKSLLNRKKARISRRCSQKSEEKTKTARLITNSLMTIMTVKADSTGISICMKRIMKKSRRRVNDD